MFRSVVALLLLATYLLLAGMGCITTPNDVPNDLVMVQTHHEGQRYEECRYLRMDGLENFMMESLATRYQDAPTTPPQHILTVVQSIDMHCLPDVAQLFDIPLSQILLSTSQPYLAHCLLGLPDCVYTPPWRG